MHCEILISCISLYFVIIMISFIFIRIYYIIKIKTKNEQIVCQILL